MNMYFAHNVSCSYVYSFDSKQLLRTNTASRLLQRLSDLFEVAIIFIEASRIVLRSDDLCLSSSIHLMQR